MAAPKIEKLLTKYNFTDTNNTGRIKYIVIHYVGALGGAKANCQYYASQYLGASAHYFVGFDGEIWQSVKDEDVAWHCGAKNYKHAECRNSNSIGIELCVRNKGSQADTSKDWYFEDATVASAVELTKYLMKKYNVPADHVIRHYDVTGKVCPNPYVYNKTKHVWNDFKKAITGTKAGKTEKPQTPQEPQKPQESKKNETEFKPYFITTTTEVLRIRDKPNGNIVGAIREKEGHKKKYTIVEEQNAWGRLKSGAGWISLEFCKKTGETTEAFVPYLITTTCDVLLVRKAPGGVKVGSICEKEGHKNKYAIVEEQNGWGRLKSGAGWISLKYCKKTS